MNTGNPWGRSVHNRLAHHLLWWATLGLLSALSAAAAADDSGADSARVTIQPGDGVQLASADETVSLSIHGYFQLYYDFRTVDAEPDHSSFSFRRLRTDLRGQAFGEKLTFRLMPEFAGQTRLLDGWASYRFAEGLQLQGGQFNVPFNWERDVSTLRHLFAERSVANDEFQWPGGRDIGLMAHGTPTDDFRYAAGIFSGQGANQPRSDSPGHLVTARLAYALFGEYPNSEVPVVPTETLDLAVGAGAFYAHDNTARDWASWHSDQPVDADVFNTTADMHLRFSVVSAHLSGFYRNVMPGPFAGPEELPADEFEAPPPLDSFEGYGIAAQLGVSILPKRLAGAVRFSESRPNVETDAAHQREILGGIHLFHRQLDSRLQLEAGVQSEHDGDDFGRDIVANVNYQLIF